MERKEILENENKSKKKRKACEKQARRKYAPAKSGAKKKH